MITQEQLINLGFSPKEAVVYLALLELGPSTATEIARKAGINRTTSYDILESLLSDDLASLTGEAKIQKYRAESPEKVLKFLESKIDIAKERLSEAQILLPQLLSVYNIKEKPKVKFYEGIEKMKEAFEDTLTADGEILAYAIGDMIQTIPAYYFQDYFKKRIEKNIKVRVIAPDTADSRKIAENDKKELRTTILIPGDKFYFSIETDIYNEKVLVLSWKEKFAVIIESEEIASAQRKIFELSWEGAKKIQTWNSL
ncbi:MAG: helix-turn-helix domain-containing protein [Parcubacteria group bacterium]